MSREEVIEQLTEYQRACCDVESFKHRIDKLMANKTIDGEITERLNELTSDYKKAVLDADLSLARVLSLINLLSNTDRDVDVLKKYHIDGMSEKAIARQLHLSTDYVRIKRYRCYKKISAIIEKKS
jgi:DNA-binding NarL/FixJ family response regulator